MGPTDESMQKFRFIVSALLLWPSVPLKAAVSRCAVPFENLAAPPPIVSKGNKGNALAHVPSSPVTPFAYYNGTLVRPLTKEPSKQWLFTNSEGEPVLVTAHVAPRDSSGVPLNDPNIDWSKTAKAVNDAMVRGGVNPGFVALNGNGNAPEIADSLTAQGLAVPSPRDVRYWAVQSSPKTLWAPEVSEPPASFRDTHGKLRNKNKIVKQLEAIARVAEANGFTGTRFDYAVTETGNVVLLDLTQFRVPSTATPPSNPPEPRIADTIRAKAKLLENPRG